MKTSKELLEFVKSKLGTPYVYGMKGTKLTEKKYNELKKLYGSNVWDSDREKIGKVCCDCSGLISWCTGIIRGSANYKETAVKVMSIEKIADAKPGYALWKKGHIGVYIGLENGVPMYIAEDGSAYGCQKKPVTWQKWTHILVLKDIEYVFTPYTVVTTKEGVRVRKSPSEEADIIKRLPKDTKRQIVEEKKINGIRWGRIANTKRWIRLKYTKKIDG